MKVFYLQNEDGEIIQDDFEKFDDRCLEIERDKYNLVSGYNGGLFLYEYTQTEEYKAKAAEYQAWRETEELRRRRQEECFSVINRGELWYSRLTEEQKTELGVWYQAWLDVTDAGQTGMARLIKEEDYETDRCV